jgi:hypothetical protein
MHDWSDDDSLAILKNCRRAIAQDGRLLIGTSIAATDATDRTAFMDIYMMLLGGRERTEEEFRTLLGKAGFSIRRVIPTASSAHIIEAEPL